MGVYKQVFSKDLDMTFIFKREFDNNGCKEFISGFYYGKPDKSGFEMFKDANFIYRDNDYLEIEKEDIKEEVMKEVADMENICKELVNKLVSKKEDYNELINDIIYNENLTDALTINDLSKINKYRNKIVKIYDIINYIDTSIKELEKDE